MEEYIYVLEAIMFCSAIYAFKIISWLYFDTNAFAV